MNKSSSISISRSKQDLKDRLEILRNRLIHRLNNLIAPPPKADTQLTAHQISNLKQGFENLLSAGMIMVLARSPPQTNEAFYEVYEQNFGEEEAQPQTIGENNNQVDEEEEDCKPQLSLEQRKQFKAFKEAGFLQAVLDEITHHLAFEKQMLALLNPQNTKPNEQGTSKGKLLATQIENSNLQQKGSIALKEEIINPEIEMQYKKISQDANSKTLKAECQQSQIRRELVNSKYKKNNQQNDQEELIQTQKDRFAFEEEQQNIYIHEEDENIIQFYVL